MQLKLFQLELDKGKLTATGKPQGLALCQSEGLRMVCVTKYNTMMN